MQEGLWEASLPVIELLEELGVDFYIGGSVASGYSGVARMTRDVDLVVSGLSAAQTMIFARRLEGTFYVSLESVRRAIRDTSSFNIIHLASMTKIDVFVHRDSDFDRTVMRRRRAIHVEEIGRTVDFASPEDIALHKLVWFQTGNRVSDRQWYDIIGVLKVQGPKIDVSYLRRWADDQGVSEILEKALEEAGFSEQTKG